MARSLKSRLLIAAICVLVAQIPAWWFGRASKSEASPSMKFEVTRLPMQLGEWTGADTELDERLVRHVGAQSIANRVYESRQGRQIMVHLSSFSNGEFQLPHPPTMCYRNAGWSGTESWKSNDGTPRFRIMAVERDGTTALIGYWYQVGQAVVADRGQLRSALQALRLKGERWPPLVKVLMHVGGDPNDPAVKADLSRVGSLIFDWIQSQS